MSLTGTYDSQNIFARIIRREIPAARVYEDDTVLVIMDAFPQAKGHCLVIHKVSQSRNLLEMDLKHLAEVMAATQKVAKAVIAALEPDGVAIKQFNGEAAGQTVFHTHMHIIPRWNGQKLGRHMGAMSDLDELKALASEIAEKL